MKISGFILSVVFVLVLVVSWHSFIGNVSNVGAIASTYIARAEENVSNRLYQQAIGYYHQAIVDSPRQAREIYIEMKAVYEMLLADTYDASSVIRPFITDMRAAARAFPHEPIFSIAIVELNMQDLRWQNAYNAARDARRSGLRDDRMDELYFELLHMVRLESRRFLDYNTTLNGYFTVFRANNWRIIDCQGREVSEAHPYIGLVNDDRLALFATKSENILVDRTGTLRGRFDNHHVLEAGLHSSETGLIPIRTECGWIYVDNLGTALSGVFEEAGSFQGNRAAARRGNTWGFIDVAGHFEELAGITNIKLDLHGHYNHGGVIIAGSGGRYHLYNGDFNRIEGFYADGIDIAIRDGFIAFQRGGRWGFVDINGNIVQEPAFYNARSFSSGFAAVANSEGLWGFVNSDFRLVIDYQYLYAHYFTSTGVCIVSTEEGTYQLIRFMFYR